VARVLATKFEPVPVSYNKRDAIIYALGVGSSELKFTYENDDTFSVLPTYPVVLGMKGTSSDTVVFGSGYQEIPGFDIDPTMILHGEQSLEILQGPLPVEGEFTSQGRITGLYDKGKGAVMVTESIISDAKKGPIVKLIGSIFVRGAGGFGGDRGPSGSPNQPPNRPPDAVFTDKTTDNQAVLYRLSGDYNPLHIDPEMATMVGFKKPILHGLCSFGFAARAVLKQYFNNDTKLFKSISVRFANPVYPGETLATEMWKEGNLIIFQTKVVERNIIVVSNGAVESTQGASRL
jgi:acyl dehydratase